MKTLPATVPDSITIAFAASVGTTSRLFATVGIDGRTVSRFAKLKLLA